jgi:hypothetical protein
MRRRIPSCCVALCGISLLLTAGNHQRVFAQSTLPGPARTVTLDREPILSRESLYLGLGLGAAALASRTFEDSDRMERMLDRSLLDGALDPADVYGSGLTMGVASLSLLALGRAFGDERLYAVGDELSRSLLLTWAAVWALKFSINAERPNGGSYSFPSGHTATAFAVAPVLGKHFGPTVGYVSYGMAILTGMARMEERKHYLADVLAGAAIGLVVSREVTGQTGLSWSVAPASSGMGVAVRF